MELRNFLSDDLDDIVTLERHAFQVGAYTKSMLSNIFSTRGSFNVLMLENGKVVAYIIALPLDKDSADVESIAVDPDYQEKGLGTILMEKIEEMMLERGYRTSVLEVRDLNDKAISFYRNRGYSITKHMATYYHEFYKGSKGAYRMEKNLIQH